LQSTVFLLVVSACGDASQQPDGFHPGQSYGDATGTGGVGSPFVAGSSAQYPAGVGGAGGDGNPSPLDAGTTTGSAGSAAVTGGGGAGDTSTGGVPATGGDTGTGGVPATGGDAGTGGVPAPDLPEIHNLSGSPDGHVAGLVREAIDGLGFPGGSDQGPVAADRFFVGRYYVAWIDQTGFYGKMNGLWRLNAATGEDLDFVVRDGGRPVNFFIVGEMGDGAWAPGYRGSEHVEFPSRTPEPNDDPGCADRDWCNQYGFGEAAPITDPDIPWWSSCNAGSPAFTDLFLPVIDEAIDGGIKLVYEGPFTKQADGDGNRDGDNCHADWLFPDGERRRVYMRLGYELFGDRNYFDRTMQLINPDGNPEFDGPMSLIGGFVLTRWPDPHPLKRFNLFLRPEHDDVRDSMHDITLDAGEWNSHDYEATTRDEVYGWLDQPFSMSASDNYLAGRSATLSHEGPSDNEDVGICLCYVHGAIEMGGGLIHGGISLPIDGGGSTIEARRRLALPGSDAGEPGTP
jgi:hypothetical protein